MHLNNRYLSKWNVLPRNFAPTSSIARLLGRGTRGFEVLSSSAESRGRGVTRNTCNKISNNSRSHISQADVRQKISKGARPRKHPKSGSRLKNRISNAGGDIGDKIKDLFNICINARRNTCIILYYIIIYKAELAIKATPRS